MDWQAKTALGSQKKIVGEIKSLKPPFRFQDLKSSLKGKILICPGKISREILEKAKALEVSGIVCESIDESEKERIKKEMKSPWSPVIFGLMVIDQDLGKVITEISGKTATIDLKKKSLIINH